MDYFPKFNVTRFEQLKPGELFFIELLDHRTVALKAVDPERNGDTLMVLLGPTSPPQIYPGTLTPWEGATVISLSSDFVVRLPTSPAGWSNEAPPPEVLAMVLRDGELFVRANFNPYPNKFQPCHVSLADGKVHYKVGHTIRSFASAWEICLREGKILHSVLKMGD